MVIPRIWTGIIYQQYSLTDLICKQNAFLINYLGIRI